MARWVVRQCGAYLHWTPRFFKSLEAPRLWIDRKTLRHGGCYYIRKEKSP